MLFSAASREFESQIGEVPRLPASYLELLGGCSAQEGVGKGLLLGLQRSLTDADGADPMGFVQSRIPKQGQAAPSY